MVKKVEMMAVKITKEKAKLLSEENRDINRSAVYSRTPLLSKALATKRSDQIAKIVFQSTEKIRSSTEGFNRK